MPLLDTVRAVKAGKQKLEDVPEGLRKQVQRLLPHVGATPPPPPRFTSRFVQGARERTTRSG